MISIIAAIGKNNELGKDNDLIWHLKGDLINFKNITMGKKIVMGSNTYLSLPKRLEGREYIVLSNPIIEVENALVYDDFNELLNFLKSLDEEVMIIGGASIYKLFISYADKLYLTEIDDSKPADVYFPDFDRNDYDLISTEETTENNINYKKNVYLKR